MSDIEEVKPEDADFEGHKQKLAYDEPDTDSEVHKQKLANDESDSEPDFEAHKQKV